MKKVKRKLTEDDLLWVKATVIKIMKSRRWPWTDFDDVLQEAYTALVEASHVYDKERGIPFRAFAYSCVKHRLNNHIKRIRRWGKIQCRELNEDTDHINDREELQIELRDLITKKLDILSESQRKRLLDLTLEPGPRPMRRKDARFLLYVRNRVREKFKE